MKRSTLISLLLGLSLLGLADAWYLAETAMTGGQLACDINGLNGCNIVATSPYAHLWGVPLGVYGVVFYALFLLISFVAFYKPSRKIDGALALLGTVGLLASIAFLYIQLALIKALCIYCVGSAVIAFLLAAAAAKLYHKAKQAPEAASIA